MIYWKMLAITQMFWLDLGPYRPEVNRSADTLGDTYVSAQLLLEFICDVTLAAVGN